MTMGSRSRGDRRRRFQDLAQLVDAAEQLLLDEGYAAVTCEGGDKA